MGSLRACRGGVVTRPATIDRARGVRWITVYRAIVHGHETAEVEQWERARDALGRATRTGGAR